MENSIVLNQNNSEIILYQPDETIQLEVRMEEDTVWLTQQQMTLLFGRDKSVISRHIRNIFTEGEVSKEATVAFFATVQLENERQVVRQLEYYNLDVIISVGYRVKSIRGTQFRQWATRVLKEKLLHGSSHLYRIERLEHRMDNAEQQLDFFVKTSLPPVEGVFYDGQIFDAYSFASDLIKTAKKSIVLIDNYIDESILLMLAKRDADVSAKIITRSISATLKLDLDRHGQQYLPIEVDSMTWTLTDEGRLYSDLLPNAGYWDVNWITTNTMILSRIGLGVGDDDFYYQLQFSKSLAAATWQLSILIFWLGMYSYTKSLAVSFLTVSTNEVRVVSKRTPTATMPMATAHIIVFFVAFFILFFLRKN